VKEHPIIFSGTMVRAILDGRKTQTRRIVKLPRGIQRLYRPFPQEPRNVQGVDEDGLIGWYATPDACPYGQPGDQLWVRETHYRFGRYVKNGLTPSGRQRWRFRPSGATPGMRGVRYAEQATPLAKRADLGWHRRPAIFMPYFACRLKLEVTSVRVERLQEISETNAIAEGVKAGDWITHRGTMGPFDCEVSKNAETAREAFRALWDSINAKRAPWAENPWVWVIEFEKTPPSLRNASVTI